MSEDEIVEIIESIADRIKRSGRTHDTDSHTVPVPDWEHVCACGYRCLRVWDACIVCGESVPIV